MISSWRRTDAPDERDTMMVLSVRLVVAVALVVLALAPGIAQPWQDTAVVALGAGLVTVLIKGFRARQTDRSSSGR